MQVIQSFRDHYGNFPETYTGMYEVYSSYFEGYEFGASSDLSTWERTEWYKDGVLHREDGPAIIFKSGRVDYYVNGILHRNDGPAIIYPDKEVVWSYQGHQLSKIEYFDRLSLEEKENFIWNLDKWNKYK